MAPYPWQIKNWNFLVSEIFQKRLTHALLLHGSQGLGKIDFAIAFATYLLCDHPEINKACGVCQSCRWITSSTHPDFSFIALEEKSKAIKIDQVRALTTWLGKTSQRIGYQVALMKSADSMNRAASNALLKTLEEPSGKVLIVLVTDRISRLSATIQSRCQKLAFLPAESDVGRTWLLSQLTPGINVDLLLRVADNLPLRALYYAKENYLQYHKFVLQHLLAIQQYKVNPIAPAAYWLQKNISFILLILMNISSDILRLQQGVPISGLHRYDCCTQLKLLSEKLENSAVHDYFQSCQNAVSAIETGIHLNVQLLLEQLLIKFFELCRK